MGRRLTAPFGRLREGRGLQLYVLCWKSVSRGRVRLGWLTQGLFPAACLDSSLTACSGVESTAAPQKLLILDARSYTAAVANRAKGGGCECEGTAVPPPSIAGLCSGWLR